MEYNFSFVSTFLTTSNSMITIETYTRLYVNYEELDFAYEDVNNPITFDGITSYIILGGLSLIGVAFVSVILKKEQKN